VFRVGEISELRDPIAQRADQNVYETGHIGRECPRSRSTR
jgi:hypothetical protein